jgi:uncharacterized repeat protein (TIGR01451 family)
VIKEYSIEGKVRIVLRRVNKKKIRTNLAVSEIIGTVLMLGIASSSFSILYFNVVNSPVPIPSPIVEISGMIDDNQVVVMHRGGEPLDLDTDFTLNIGGTLKSYKVGDLLDSDSKEDGAWSLGEKLFYPLEYDFDYSVYPNIDINIIDRESNSIVMTGVTKINPTCDLGVVLSVDRLNPREFEDIYFNLIVTNYEDINASGARIKFLLPDGLTYVSSSSAQGSYNSTNGYWDIGQIKSGESVSLTVRATVGDVIYGEPTQLTILLDGSASISPPSWDLMLTGLANAVGNKNKFTQSGVVELTVIQFGGKKIIGAQLEVGPVVVTESNVYSVVSDIINIEQMGDKTPTSCAVFMAANVLKTSAMYHPNIKQTVLLVTDGNPTHSCGGDGDYVIDSITGVGPKDAVKYAREFLVDILNCSEDQDSFNAISVELQGSGHSYELRDNVVWPQPGYDTVNFSNYIPNKGWVRRVNSWQEFADSIEQSFDIIFNTIKIKTKIESTSFSDPKIVNDESTLVLKPLP